MQYRRDIDGLRAVAVLSVLLFHAFPGWLPGGFAGVDVFFVLSGFLITGILVRDGVDLRSFYERRVRRLLPALCAVALACLVAGWFVLLADEYAQLGLHVAGGTAFASNFVLLREVGYFSPAAESKPLLHLWSLGIEEQFYLLLPAVLATAHRRGWRVLPVFAVLASLSFALGLVLDGPPAFYLPVTRFWELLAGALLATWLHARGTAAQDTGVPLRSAGSLLGLALLAMSFFALSSTDPYPGWRAAVPVVGTLLLLAAGAHAWCNRVLLATRLPVAVGRISYPLYLWHWPLLAFTQVIEAGPPATRLRWAALGAAVVLAALTYVVIERPLRHRRAGWVVPGLLVVFAAVGLAGGTIALQGGVPQRAMARAGAGITAARADWTYQETTFAQGRIEGLHVLQGRSDAKVLFAGSSFMGQYWPRAQLQYQPDAGARPLLGTVYASRNHCAALPGNPMRSAPEGITCDEYYRAVLVLARGEDIHTVVLGGPWPQLAAGAEPTPQGHRFVEDLRALALNGKRVVLLADSPAYVGFEPGLLAKSLRRDGTGLGPDRWVPRSQIQDAAKLRGLRTIAGLAGAEVIDPYDWLCSAQGCPITRDGQPLYRDRGHLRASYARDSATFVDAIVGGLALPPGGLAP